MTTENFEVRPERTEDFSRIESLAERAFGPGRFARTAHRVREQGVPVSELSLCAWKGDTFAGSIRFTAITIGDRGGALLLGPLMVESEWNGKGCGKALIEVALSAAREAGYQLVILVGDLPYYERFGFAPVPPGQIIMPGPVDPRRLLACELVNGALENFTGLMAAEKTG